MTRPNRISDPFSGPYSFWNNLMKKILLDERSVNRAKAAAEKQAARENKAFKKLQASLWKQNQRELALQLRKRKLSRRMLGKPKRKYRIPGTKQPGYRSHAFRHVPFKHHLTKLEKFNSDSDSSTGNQRPRTIKWSFTQDNPIHREVLIHDGVTTEVDRTKKSIDINGSSVPDRCVLGDGFTLQIQQRGTGGCGNNFLNYSHIITYSCPEMILDIDLSQPGTSNDARRIININGCGFRRYVALGGMFDTDMFLSSDSLPLGSSGTLTAAEDNRYVKCLETTRLWFKRYFGFAGVTPDNPNDEDLADAVWEATRPSLTGKFSLLNFLYELKDFKGLLRVVGQPKKFFRFFTKQNVSLERGLQLVGELHLQWCFAIAPLITDLGQLYDRILNHVEMIKNFVTAGKGDNGRGTRRRYIYRYKGDPEAGNQVVSLNPIFGGGDYKLRIKFTSIAEKPNYDSGGVVFTYACPKLNGYWKWMQAKLDVFGINLNAQTAWNALPFSFVVDWFVDVGQFLRSRRSDSFSAISVRIHDFYITRRRALTQELWLVSPNGDEKLVSISESSFYERFQTVPRNYQNLKLPEFSVTKVLLGLSLAKCLSNKRFKFLE